MAQAKGERLYSRYALLGRRRFRFEGAVEVIDDKNTEIEADILKQGFCGVKAWLSTEEIMEPVVGSTFTRRCYSISAYRRALKRLVEKGIIRTKKRPRKMSLWQLVDEKPNV